jgi:hypothetical protein
MQKKTDMGTDLPSHCRGQPWGSPKTTGETPLKTCKKNQS